MPSILGIFGKHNIKAKSTQQILCLVDVCICPLVSVIFCKICLAFFFSVLFSIMKIIEMIFMSHKYKVSFKTSSRASPRIPLPFSISASQPTKVVFDDLNDLILKNLKIIYSQHDNGPNFYGVLKQLQYLEITWYMQFNKHLNCINRVLQLSVKDVEK